MGGRDDFSTYKPAKLAEGESEVQITKTREVIDGVTPFFREKPMDLALTEGEPLRISCLVASEPRAAMQWLKNDLIFMDDSRLKVVNTEDGWSHLTLDPAMPSDAGLYRVVARNPLGQTSCSVRVVLGDISGPPDSPSIEAMTDTDILLSWQTPAQLNHSAVLCYKVQMGYIDTDIDWVDLADDIKHEYFVVDTAEALSYEIEKKPMKSRNETPGSLDFMSELAKGRFSVTANVNKEGKVYSVKLFGKASTEGGDAATREFKNLKTLRHEKMVSLVDAFETDRFSLLQFNSLPSTDVLSYIAERPFYTEIWSVTLQDRFWMLLNTSTGVARSTSTWNHLTSLSALADLLEDPSRSSLPTLRLHRLLPAMELRSREHTTLTTLLPRSSRRPKPILSLMFGLLVFFSMSSCLDNFHSRESLPRRPRTTSSMSSSSLSICTRSAPWRAPDCSCGYSRRLPSDVHLWRRLGPTGG